MARKKKAQKKVKKKKKQTVATIFKCPFCSHDKSVECNLDRERNIGHVNCRICGASYQSNINYLSEPIDVFTDWIDDCEETHRQENEQDDLE